MRIPTNHWHHVRVYHGSSVEGLNDLRQNGIRLDKCEGGYFGYGFYVTDKRDLAISNYAEKEDDTPSIVSFTISPSAKILDLRDSDAWGKWKTLEKHYPQLGLGDPNIALFMVKNGVDGVYDNSMDGLCIYNFSILTDPEFTAAPSEAESSPES
jgi:hypothetical protein